MLSHAKFRKEFSHGVARGVVPRAQLAVFRSRTNHLKNESTITHRGKYFFKDSAGGMLCVRSRGNVERDPALISTVVK
jgi:hypothetical protein